VNIIVPFLQTRPATLVDALHERAERDGDRNAFVFLRYRSAGPPEPEPLTYAGLLARAQTVAAALQERCARGDRALILAPPGLDYIAAFFGCALAGVVAVPAYPPRNAKHMERLAAIAGDCGATVVLAMAELAGRLAEWGAGALPDALALELLSPGAGSSWHGPAAQPGDLAFLQYTSGTTGTPKGVMVGHDNLMANFAAAGSRSGLGPADTMVTWLPPYHDLGLIAGLLQAVYSGFTSVVMVPAAFLQDPARWIQALSDYRATLTLGPNFGYELACDVNLDAAGTLDLSAMRHAFMGGEPPRAATLRRFARRLAAAGFRSAAFRPAYGLAETTLQVALSLSDRQPRVMHVDPAAADGTVGRVRVVPAESQTGMAAVSNGPPIDGTTIRIVHPETGQTLAPGDIGEVWVAGPTVTRGYWKRPDTTAATFGARCADDPAGGPFLRTGDLGAMVDGELFVLGRIKDLIIIRGRNLYAQDIEATVADSHTALAADSTIAFGIEHGAEEKLVIVHGLARTALRNLDAASVFAAIRQAVVETHEVDPHAIVLVRPASLPRTTSGKLQRLKTREMFTTDSLAVVEAWRAADVHPSRADGPDEAGALTRRLQAVPVRRRTTRLRQVLAERVQAALGLADPPDEGTGFATLGIDSLRAVQFGHALNRAFALDPPLPATVLFDQPNTGALATLIARRLGWPEEETAPQTASPPAQPGMKPEIANQGIAKLGIAKPGIAKPGIAKPGIAKPGIAIVGLAARVPGAANADGFWRLLADTVDATTEIPRDRFDIDAWFDRDPEVPGKIYTRRGGFLDGIDLFDADFFGINPREAASMDPQQRLLLEAAWQALEDAAIAPERLRGSRTGVFVGAGPGEYGAVLGSSALDAYFGTGLAPSVMAGRIAFVLGLEGPAMTIDTACSSSLVAVHQACQALRAGECDAALAGGVNLILGVQSMLATCGARMLSPDGRCKTFDAAADGYARGEGCGVVVLKRLVDAERDGDRILAVIRGSAVNQDGASGGLTVPNGPSQRRLIEAALAQAGIPPADVAYLETHGTGTKLGDPIEVQAAAQALGTGRPLHRPLLLGAVKANIGHLEAAAGIAGLIKTVLALRAGELPGQPNLYTLNSHITWSDLPVEVVRSRRAWPEGRLVAGVSSFGFSGTNAHVVLEAYPASARADQPVAQPLPDSGDEGPRPDGGDGGSLLGRSAVRGMQDGTGSGEGVPEGMPERGTHVFPLSARTAPALAALAARYQAWATAHPDDPSRSGGLPAARQSERSNLRPAESLHPGSASAQFRAEDGVIPGAHRPDAFRLGENRPIPKGASDCAGLGDLCFTAGIGRTHFARRAAIVADSRGTLMGALAALASGTPHKALRTGDRASRPRVGVLFTGQGSQWAGMARGLYATEPVFRAVVDRCAAAMADAGLHRHDLRAVMFAAAATPMAALLDDTAYAQPALYALEAGLWAVWQGLGIQAEAVLGHSLGEYAAAHAAGVLKLEDGARLVARRGALMGALQPGGAMAAVFAPLTAASTAMAAVNAGTEPPHLSLAAENGAHCVVSGPAALIDALMAHVAATGIRCQRLPVSHAFHSALLDPMLDAFEIAAREIPHRAPDLTLISNLTGAAFAAGAALDAAYWRRHARAPVRFAASVATLAAMGIDLLLEIGPRPVLAPLALGNWPDGVPAPMAVPSLRAGGDDERWLADALASLYAAGCPVDFAARDAGRTRTRLAVPSYPFERRRHWGGVHCEVHGSSPHWGSQSGAPARQAGALDGAEHALLGATQHLGSGETVHTRIMTTTEPAWLADHVVFGAVVAPGSLYACVAAAAGTLPLTLREGQILAPLILAPLILAPLIPGPQTPCEMQVLLAPPDPAGARGIRIFSRPATPGAPGEWRRHATLHLTPHADGPDGGTGKDDPPRAMDPAVPDRASAGEARADISGKPLDARIAGEDRPLPPDALTERNVDAFYAQAAALGLAYGPSFRRLTRLWSGAGVARGLITAPDGAAAGMPLHPAVLDGCFQVIAAALPDGVAASGDPFVPLGWDALTLWRAAPPRLQCEVRLHAAPAATGTVTETVLADMWLRDEAGAVFGRVRGLMLKRATRRTLLGDAANAGGPVYEVVWRDTSLAQPDAAPSPGSWLLLGDPTRRAALGSALAGRGAAVVAVSDAALPASLAPVLDHATASAPLDGVVWLSSASGRVPDTASAETCLAPVLALSQALIERGIIPGRGMAIVTQGAIAADPGEDADILQAALWGFGRVLQTEAPGLSVRLIDTAPGDEAALATALLGSGPERQLAWRSGTWRAPRLLPHLAAPRLPMPDGDVQLVVKKPGTLDGLALVPRTLDPPASGEVQIAIRAAGLNFRDVLGTLGLYPGDPGPPGGECAGEVVAVGAGVTGFAPGDRVFGFAPGCCATRCNAPADLLRPLPPGLAAAEAATLPITACTAMAAFDLAAVSAGDRVLIHAGAGGVGLAAIQLAQARGAEVYATASTGKRAFLHGRGVRHVYDSRSTSFAADILAATGGQGVDVVLNSLTGEGFIAASLSVLAPGGRFVEIGKRGIWTPDAVAAVRPDIAYHVLALDDLMRDAPAQAGALLGRVAEATAAGVLAPLPRRCFALTEASAAMRLMQRAGHIGKIVLTVDQPRVRPDGAYLVTGGLGALGLEAASWLAGQGAGRVFLAGRHGPSTTAAARIAAIAADTGCAIETRAADIADAAAVQALIDGIERDHAPLRGVIHAAGVLEDGVISSQSWNRFTAVLTPKLFGAWHLHQATACLPLDFFVLYASAAATLGSPGQSNYAAANAGLEALAQHRRALGLPATSLAWGPWDAGMAAAEPLRARLAHDGLRPLTPEPAQAAMASLLRDGTAAAVVVDADWPRLAQRLGPQGVSLLRDLIAAPAAAASSRPGLPRRPLRTAEGPDAPRDDTEAMICALFEHFTGRSPVGIHDRFFDIGGDSLAAMSFVAALRDETGHQLPLRDLFEHQTPAAIAARITPSSLGLSSLGPSAPEPPAPDRLAPSQPARSASPPQIPADTLSRGPARAAGQSGLAPLAAAPDRAAPPAAAPVPAPVAALPVSGALLVPLAPIPESAGDARPVVFCFHAVPGTVAEYIALGLLLPEFRLLAVQARGLMPGRQPETDLHALIEAYAGLVAQAAPDGPLRLVGTGAGGAIALEVMRRLRPQPRPGDVLALIDSDPPPVGRDGLPQSFEAFALRGATGLSPRAASVAAATARLVPPGMRRALFLRFLRRQFAQAPDLPGIPDISPAFVSRMIRTADATLAMLRTQWAPRPYGAPTLLVMPSGETAAGSTGAQWARLLPNLRAATVAGTRRSLGTPIPQREIAALLREAFAGGANTPDAGYNPLLPLQPAGNRPSLFCVHPLIGRSLIFRTLAEALRPDVPVWGIETRGGEPGETPFDTLDVMTDAYMRAIRMVQPRGPYHLAGHSVGGVIAQELACRLEAAGEQVAFIAMFDTPLPRSFPTDWMPQRHDVVRAVSKTLGLPHDNSVSADGATVDRLLAALIKAGHVPAGTGADWLAVRIDAGTETGRVLFALCARHQPRVCQAGIVMFRAVEETEFPPDEAFDWSALTRNGVMRVDLAANHNRILEPGCAAIAAAALHHMIAGRDDNSPITRNSASAIQA